MVNNTDILIYIALKEESDLIMEFLATDLIAKELDGFAVTVYQGKILCQDGSSTSITIVPAGKMGNVNAAALTSAMLQQFKPVNVVVLGIAGAISDDLNPGDVFIPSRVNDYLANSSAVGAKSNVFELSGNYYDTDPRLLDRFRNLSTRFKPAFNDWKNETNAFMQEHITDDIKAKLSSINVNLDRINLHVGEDKCLASGPAVAKGLAFSKWLRKTDRKIAAVEMESAGVYAAVWTTIKRPHVIAIRPISDIADERKSQIENIAGHKLRQVALLNAVSLLKKAITIGIFHHEGDAVKIRQPALVKTAFIVGGKLDQEDNFRDSGNLKTACNKIGRLLAKENIDLIVCSPFDDSADFHAIEGFVEDANKGRIHLHHPNHPEVLQHRAKVIDGLDSDKVKVIPYIYPGYDNVNEQAQAWAFCQLQALEQADVVIAIGGNLSKSANLTLRVAEVKKVLIIPFSFLGGAAEMIYKNINWKELYPNVNAKLLTVKDGIKSLPRIIGDMKVASLTKFTGSISSNAKVFISRSTKDKTIALELQQHLKIMGLDAVLGDEAISDKRSVIPAIDDYINSSQLHIILWSTNFALSPWCYDELMTAISRYENGLSSILIFNIDGSAIIPKNARSLNEVAVSNVFTMVNTVKLLIDSE